MHAVPDTERGKFGGWELVSLSWEIFSANFGILFVGHLLCWLIIQGAYSTFFGLILVGPLWCGLSLMALNAIRGQAITLEQLFSGFQKLFMPTMIITIITHCMMFASMIAVIIVGLFIGFFTFFGSFAALDFAIPETMGPVMLFSVIMGYSTFLVLLFLPALVLVVLYAPAFFIIIDQPHLEGWAAMEKSRKMVMGNWPRWRNLWIALSIVHLLGVLACCVGYFVVTPWMVVGLALAYERSREIITPPELPQSINPPPPPMPDPGDIV